MVLWHLGKVTDAREGARLVREVLDSGRAITRFRAEAEE
jgi:anthranilate phosphoribosyltransferase